MYFKNIFYFILLCLALFGWRCANIVAPTGGAKDTKPPKVVEAKSTRNLQTNFKKQPITLIFDEYVALLEAGTQVVVSPPLNETPTVTALGRIVKFTFGEGDTLRSNATYTINFGTAVRDFTEGNIATDLRFVFSTGATLDSLTFGATIVDAFTGEPVEGALLMLYDSFSDSIVRKQKPFYFSRTDKQGFAIIRNVRGGKYKLFALKDADFNYRLTQESEAIGFPDAATIDVTAFVVALPEGQKLPSKIGTDTSKNGQNSPPSGGLGGAITRAIPSGAFPQDSLKIRLFLPQKTLRTVSKNTDTYGVVRLLMSRSVDSVGIQSSHEAGEKILIERDAKKDSILVWYDAEREGAWSLYLRLDTARTDTVRIRPKSRADFLKKARVTCITIPRKVPNVLEVPLTQHPLLPLELVFSTPIVAFDSSKIKLLDSLGHLVAVEIERDSTQPRSVFLRCNWDDAMPYRVQLAPQAVTDFYGLKNDSLLTQKIAIRVRKDFGDIKLRVAGLQPNKSYVVQLMLEGTKAVVQTYRIAPNMVKDSAWSVNIPAVDPNNYAVRVVEDLNQNGVWDTGNYERHEQPERVWYKELESVRSNWEVEATIELL